MPAVPAPLEEPSGAWPEGCSGTEGPHGAECASGAECDSTADAERRGAEGDPSTGAPREAAPDTAVRDRLNGRVADLTALYGLIERLAGTDTLDAALEELLEAGAALVRARRGMVVLEPPATAVGPGTGSPDRTCRSGPGLDPQRRPGRIKGLGLSHAELGHIQTVPYATTTYGAMLAPRDGHDPNPRTRAKPEQQQDQEQERREARTADANAPEVRSVPEPDRDRVDPWPLDTPGGPPDGLPSPVCHSDVLNDTSLDPRLREVAAHLGYAASYAQPLASAAAGTLGTTVWLYDEPTAPQERQRRLIDLYLRFATTHLSRLLELEAARETVATIARELLPSRLPRLPGVTLAARHRTGPLGGGDWYDALPLPEGALGLAVGSVSGSGPSALAAMGRLRASLRAYAVMEGEDPVAVLSDLELLLRLTEPARTATALFAYAEPAAKKMVLAGAGHTPPLVIGERRTEFVETSLSAPLGMLACWEAPSVEISPAPGETVLLYTDGLLRCTGDSVDRAFARLHTAAAGVPKAARGNPDAIADHMLRELLPEGLDQASSEEDIVLLAVCFD
ncbi:PP2C family protein-serine/threonine phosphatase [Streptomyces sp. NPDC005963]|uniref:PP2C family protein-serine/threonine phosphatase n=1 Tax=Streptomyces sp. NPDC005963 TaxID=3156721 RepID=UPI00340E5610